MVLGIGVDIVENERIAALYAKNGNRFLQKIFSEDEIHDVANECNLSVQHISGIFAAKESVIKAISGICPAPIAMSDITIAHDAQGKPFALVPKFTALERYKLLVSISHEKKYSIALAVLDNADQARSQKP